MPTAILEGLEQRLRPRTPGPRLTVLQPGLPELEQPLHGSLYRIGRAADNAIVIDHTAVSRHHALLENHGGHWLLSDAGSTNGLWWRGRRVRGLVLRAGDRVRFGPADQEDLPTLLFESDGSTRLDRLGRWGA
ncbi:FHA domain-containing protein, partial [Synechococcus sp. BA-120 BA3]|nr:FHA domain-containing protein [Synechococcus sp. BA-120 BA3]